DTSDLARLSFVKTGAVTHSLNMESGRMDLDYQIIDGTTVEVSLPDNPNVVGAGNWMLFALDDAGVPSVAPIISVEPTLPLYREPGALEPVDGEITAEYFAADAQKLDDVNFDGTPIFSESLTKIQEDAQQGAFYSGGPIDKFAAKYTGEFSVATSGQYTFYLNSDDGSSLSIDGQQIILNDGLHADIEKQATIQLDAGTHTLDARYFEQGGFATMELDWKGPDFVRGSFEVNGEGVEEPGNVIDDIPNQTQYLTGETDTDTFAIDGNSGDYGWGATQDGEGIVVWGPTGHDLLYDFETIKFNDQSVSLVKETGPDGGMVVNDDPNRTQSETGTDKSDKFVIDGNSSKYGWDKTLDNEGIVVWNIAEDTHDLLYDFEELAFNDEVIDLEADFA
ncbi:MAG: galactose oxidase-like domain-containing protein, partial [Planctomycetota bacterium]